MAHIIRENAGKKTKTISELFTNKIFEFTFVSIFADMTIVQCEIVIDIQLFTYEVNRYIHSKLAGTAYIQGQL